MSYFVLMSNDSPPEAHPADLHRRWSAPPSAVVVFVCALRRGLPLARPAAIYGGAVAGVAGWAEQLRGRGLHVARGGA